jgi:hypothetical protein
MVEDSQFVAPIWHHKFLMVTSKFEVAICDLREGIKVSKWYLEAAVFLISAL